MRQQQQQQGLRQGDANRGGRGQSHSNQADQTDETGGGVVLGRRPPPGFGREYPEPKIAGRVAASLRTRLEARR
jgi:hypothetical protein